MIDESTGADAFKRVSIGKLDALVALAETAHCRRRRLLAYFGEELHETGCGNCDNCLSPPKVRDGKVVAQKMLSCVYRTGQRFGAMHLIDVLVGTADREGHAVRARQIVGVRRRPRAQRKAMARRAAPAGGDGASARRQRGLWRAEADGVLARRAERRDRGVAARAGGEYAQPRDPKQFAARRSWRRRPTAAAKGDPALHAALKAWRSEIARTARRAGLCGAARFHHRRHRRDAPGDARRAARHRRDRRQEAGALRRRADRAGRTTGRSDNRSG